MKINKAVILAICMVLLFTSSCRTSRVSQVQLQLVQYALKESDLTGNWNVTGQAPSVAFGGESYDVGYERDDFVFINHTVSMHSSIERTQQAYAEWETRFFGLPNSQPDVSYIPLDPTDDHRIECSRLEPDDPIMVCVYLQRHNTLISFVKVGFDNRSLENLTVDDMGDILQALDKRLNGLDN